MIRSQSVFLGGYRFKYSYWSTTNEYVSLIGGEEEVEPRCLTYSFN